MLTIEKRKRLKIMFDLLWVILWFFFAVIGIVITFTLIFCIRWTNIGSYLLTTVLFFIGTVLISFMINQSVTEILSENFRIEFDDEHFIFKSIFIMQIIKYEDIEEIYTVRRHYSKRREIDLLKIKGKSSKKVYISFEVLDKKEEKELKRIFKEKTGKKIRDKFQFWE